MPDTLKSDTLKLEAIHQDVMKCRACRRLVEWRELVAREKRAAYMDEDYWGKPVPGFGDPNAKIVIMGLAPAAHGANRTGRMFTGDRSGDWLYGALYRAGLATQAESTSLNDGLKLKGVYITAPVKCAPPANKPTPAEKIKCKPYLERELECLSKAKVFLALGHIAYSSLMDLAEFKPKPKLKPKSKPGFAHGLEVNLPDGRSIVCSYHVSQQNTFTGRLTQTMFAQIIRRVKKLAGLS